MPSLALLEYLTSVDLEDVPGDLRIVCVDVPDDAIRRVRVNELPKDWRDVPSPESTKRFGDVQFESKRSLAFAVPSVVLPAGDPGVEWDIVIDPAHARFPEIQPVSTNKIDIGRFFVR